jgi:dihydroflavonol-4-reductase
MVVAVTGASGHVGTNLLPLLIEKGYQVRVLIHRNTHVFKHLNVTPISGDLLNKKSLTECIDGARTVLHLAGQITINRKSDEVLRVNVDGTRNLLEASMELGVKKFVFFSSIHALNVFPLNGKMDENRDLNFGSQFDYDRSKVNGEEMILEASRTGLNGVILNPTAIIGPKDHRPSLLGRAICQMYSGKIPALLNGGYNFVDVRDVAEATLQAIEKGRSGQRYIISGYWRSIRELAEAIHSNGGRKPPPLTVPFWMARMGADILNYFSAGKDDEKLYTPASLDTLEQSHKNISHDKASRELGYRPREFEQTIHDTVTWFNQNNEMK